MNPLRWITDLAAAGRELVDSLRSLASTGREINAKARTAFALDEPPPLRVLPLEDLLQAEADADAVDQPGSKANGRHKAKR